MKICIFGTGAIGSLIGGKLAQAGKDVRLIARGRQLEALRAHGLILRCKQNEWNVRLPASDTPADFGPQDLVILCTKSYHIAEAAEHMQPLLADHTVVLPVINGIPWWYFQRYQGGHAEFAGRHLKSLDPQGHIAGSISSERIIGAANYLAATVVAPGVVEYVDAFSSSLIIGELDGTDTPRLNQLFDVLSDAGFDPAKSETIRNAVWRKLWGNIAFNPVSALTHATMDAIVNHYDDTDLIMAIMNEARLIAEKLDVDMGESTTARIARASRMVGHKTSMLVDMEQGRQTEIEAIVGAVREIGHWLEESTPHLNGLYSLVRLKERFNVKAA